MSDIEYSVITSDVIKSFDCIVHSAMLLTCIEAIIGPENQFSVFLRVAVLHKFYCSTDSNKLIHCIPCSQ